MAKPVKSQWDFGELFQMEPQRSPAPAPSPSQPSQPQTTPPPKPPAVESRRRVLSVTELTSQIKNLLEKQVGVVWVSGEVTNLRAQSSGHIYFTLKDGGAQLSAVLFRGERGIDRSLIEDGRKLTVRGEVTVYEPRGQYQLRILAVELHGIGALQAAFEKLKQKLNAEGLFARERKRPLPCYPQRIGLVTSATGAAIRDVLHVVERRNPALEIVLVSCRVQGEGAAQEIAAAIRLLNEFHARPGQSRPLDLILVTRGGGSLEDLWAFNEEAVARAVFESALPVVSAVGHEIDFTICDFVADFRAATPSAGAEIITEGVFSSCQFLSAFASRVGQLARKQLADKSWTVAAAAQRLARLHPRKRLNEHLQRLDDLQGTLARCAAQGLRHQRVVARGLVERLLRVRPAVLLRQRREVFELAQQRLREQSHHHLRELRNRVGTLEARLRLLGPEQVLARGYSITRNAETGEVIRDKAQTRPGQQLETRLKSGTVVSRIEGAS
jgi:exodeoxyribonuclease VII large subunit